jgi:hypothetical protein
MVGVVRSAPLCDGIRSEFMCDALSEGESTRDRIAALPIIIVSNSMRRGRLRCRAADPAALEPKWLRTSYGCNVASVQRWRPAAGPKSPPDWFHPTGEGAPGNSLWPQSQQDLVELRHRFSFRHGGPPGGGRGGFPGASRGHR